MARMNDEEEWTEKEWLDLPPARFRKRKGEKITKYEKAEETMLKK